ncbi:MAG: TonB-dependent receptor [Opitutales bacterium]|nr:TonB-dependent receptor [Opitutales bacterium]
MKQPFRIPPYRIPAQSLFLGVIGLSTGLFVNGEEGMAPPVELETFFVFGERVANERPASGVATPVTALRFDPLVEVQARGPAERQADITVRGGIFENTGFSLNGLPLPDPQTGHYFGEIPLDPRMLRGPEILTGKANALGGFNSTVATIHYDLTRVETGGELEAGIGQNGLNFQRVYAGVRLDKVVETAPQFSVDVGYARAEGRGTVDRGDFDYERFSGRLQIDSRLGRTDIFAGYADEFHGWPGLYIGRAFGTLFPETDDFQVTLAGFWHDAAYGDGSYIGGGGIWRRLVDEYQFNRDNPSPVFTHETRVNAGSVRGRHVFAGGGVDYHLTAVADRLVFSRALTFGNFDSRRYARLAVIPFLRRDAGDGGEWEFRAGATLDTSNRDATVVLPVLGVRRSGAWLETPWTLYAEFSTASQVPGYTALASNPSGLFGGNADLGREKARNFELGGRLENDAWQLRAAIFRREDRALVDWVFLADSPSARRAAPVDIDVTGFEAVVALSTGVVRWVGGYAFLRKEADYGSMNVDASYYALNFPEHRFTLAAIARPFEQLQVRVDSEYRQQADNFLRTGAHSAFRLSAGLAWQLPVSTDIEWGLVGDNLTNNRFETFPGTPADGRQLSTYLRLRW